MSAPTRWCSAPGCMTNIKITKRHFFKFPKDRERWLEWIKACNRMDLEKIGPEYTNLYYRLCHLHFRIDLFKNIEGKIFLNREAVPSIFLKSIQAENVKSGDLVQPLSFVTIFLKPESRSKNSSIDLSTLVQSEPSLNKKMPFLNKSDEKNTLTIPTLKVLFPRTSIKQTLENRKYHVTVLERKSENDNGNTSTTKIQLVKDVHANSAASIISSQLKKEFNDKNIIDLTISDSLMSTMSSTHSTPQHSNRDIVGLTNSDSLLSTTLSTIVPLTHSTPQHSNRNSLDLTNSNSVLPTTSSTIVVPSTHSTPQHDNRNIIDLTNSDSLLFTTSSTIVPSIHSTPQHGNKNILDLNSDSSLSTTSSTIVPSTHSTPQHGNRTSKRKHWHISTQTPEAWLYIDSFLKKKQMEKCETCAVSLATKRRKVLSTEEADQHLNVEQVKTACANLLPRASALLFSACIDVQKMRKNGKNFDRQFALRLFFAAPIAYRSYRMLRLLPTVRQLRRHIRSWDMPPGLNDNILNALRLKMKSLPPLERRCCLCVHEMRLQPHLFYNLSRDRIVGFYEIGAEKRRILARKALVVMARSLAGDWEQPVAYYFHGGACNADVTKNLIFQAIIKLTHIGATVHALITGTAPMFLRLSQRLGISAERPWFLVNGEKIFYIFDVARLMRATRNVLMTHEICFREKKASWADIELFFRCDSQKRLPLAPKLSVSHLKPSERQKIETKYAVEVFSDRVAAGLSACIASGEFSLRAIGTMEFVYNFDQLFDILNSRSASTKHKEFGEAFTGNMREMRFLQQTLDFLKSIRVVDKSGAHVKSIKCFDRWRVTINAITQLWDVLKEHRFSFLRTRRLNREGIERAFRSIKQQSGNRARPTPIFFTRAFKNLVSKHLLEHLSKIDSVVSAQKILKRIASASSRHVDRDPPVAAQTALSISATNYRDIDLRLPEKSAFKRVCEFLLAECLRAHDNCDVCVAYVAEESGSHAGKDAPGSFNFYISGLEDTFMRIFEQLSAEENIGARMLQYAQQVEYKPPCPDFPVTFLIKLFLRMRIYFTLLRHNRICRGADSRDYLKVMQL